MKQLFYKTIYNDKINRILRNANKWIYPVLPEKVKIPPSGILTLSIQDQKLKIKTNQTNYITQYIFWNGYQDFEYTGIFLKLIGKIDVFFDIGANIGYYSLLAALMNPAVKVISFEPAAGPLHYLKENIRLNNYFNIHVEPVALSDLEGETDFYEIRNEKYRYLKYNLSGEGNTGSKTEERFFTRHTVKTTTLDAYCVRNHVKSIDLIKLDTEGTEPLILQKAEETITRMKPVIICETLFGTTENELDYMMKSFGYDFFNHKGHGLIRVDSIKRKKDDGIRNCFMVHPSRFSLIEEFVLA